MPGWRMVVKTAAAALLGACVSLPPPTPKLAVVDVDQGYRTKSFRTPATSGDILFIAFFSGGGTRAAALAYGALETLRDTPIEVNGVRRRLLDELDIVHAVSGGSIVAAYYGAFGERIFEDFEAKFLKFDFEAALVHRALLPSSWVKLASARYGRGDLLAETLDAQLFAGKTYADLLAQPARPMIVVNATDMSIGSRLPYDQAQFDWLCADLGLFPIARAVASSAALPPFFSPLTVDNYAGGCGFKVPAQMHPTEQDGPALAQRKREELTYLDRARRPFIHALDGGLVDNLGLGGALAESVNDPGFADLLESVPLQGPHSVLVLSVNGERDPDLSIDLKANVPDSDLTREALFDVPSKVVSTASRAYLRIAFREYAERVRARYTAAGSPGEPPRFYLIEARLGDIADPGEREFAMSVPTALKLPAESVDHLRALARQLMEASPDFQRLKKDIGPR